MSAVERATVLGREHGERDARAWWRTAPLDLPTAALNREDWVKLSTTVTDSVVVLRAPFMVEWDAYETAYTLAVETTIREMTT